MKRILSFFLLFCMLSVALLCAVSCAGSSLDADGGAAGYPLYKGSESAPADGASTEGGSSSNQTRPAAGTITACAWDDNAYYDFFRSEFAQGSAEDGSDNGKFYDFPTKDWYLDSSHRLTVTVTCGDAPVAGAVVTAISAAEKVVGTAVTDARGIAYLFASDEVVSVSAVSGTASASADVAAGESAVTLALESAAEKLNYIQLMFVLDVTGSMGDELTYLQKEVEYVINYVAGADAETRIQLALLFYRDDGDREKFAYHDFLDVTNAGNLALQLQALNGQSATGGGDYPEAVDEALELAMSKQWSDGAATKLIFHLLDAPPHEDDAKRTRYAEAVTSAAAQGIRVCPILASGADLLCEYLCRQTAVMTGGTFIFITDHSGIGGAHYDPALPNVVVEHLNDLMVRLILGYHTGTFAPPVAWNAPAEEPAPAD